MAKAKLRYEQVYTKRNVRDPIDWDKIEAIRNEGYELINIFGSLGESVRNPAIAPIYAIFKKIDMLATPGVVDELKKVKGELKALKAKPKKSRFAAAAEKSLAKDN